MRKLSIIAGWLLLAACSDRGTTHWIGVIDSSVDAPYAEFSNPSGTFKTYPECERAMKAAAGEQREMPPLQEGFVVRTLYYRCKQVKEGKAEKLVGTKYVLLPAKP